MSNIIGYVVSDPTGKYNEDVCYPRDKAEALVHERNRCLSAGVSGLWEIGARFDDGSVEFC